ncbi:MAG: ROK family transcriptional regulator [Propionibacteriaceae bacterium]|nr:ROK family transcriptional regulator [Propionibacteriaceae bacterium]
MRTRTPLTPADSPSLLRQRNLEVVLRTIRRSGPISRPAIARETGLSNPTVTHVVQLLLDKGYVTETESDPDSTAPKRPGPRARYLNFCSDRGFLLGIDAGADNTVSKLADLSGEVLATARIGHDRHPERHRVLAAIRSTAAEVLARAGVTADQLHAVVIGTPGVVDPITGALSLAPQIDGWEGLALATELRDLADCPIVAENEANLSLLAERWQGGAQTEDDVVYVQFGVGIGGALLVGGELYRGRAGAAGEFAYLTTGDPEEEDPRRSSAGRFEWFAGGGAYRRHGTAAAGRPDGALLLELAGDDPEAVTARVVFEAAAQADPAALRITDELLTRMGRGLANIAAILNPGLILIGGGISTAGQLVLEPIQRQVAGLIPYPPRIELSRLGDNGTVLGAVRRAMQIANERLYNFNDELHH